jgi:hypothetical protein
VKKIFTYMPVDWDNEDSCYMPVELDKGVWSCGLIEDSECAMPCSTLENGDCKYFRGLGFPFSGPGKQDFVICLHQKSMGIRCEEYPDARVVEHQDYLQSITYRAFELAESAIKAAIAQAIEEQFND